MEYMGNDSLPLAALLARKKEDIPETNGEKENIKPGYKVEID